MAFIPEVYGEINGKRPVICHPAFQVLNKEGDRPIERRPDNIAALIFHGYRINLAEQSGDRFKVLLMEDPQKEINSPDALSVYLATELTDEKLEITTTTRRYDLLPSVGIVVDTHAFVKSLTGEVDDRVNILSRWNDHEEHPLRNSINDGRGYQLPSVTRLVLEEEGKIVIDPGYWRNGRYYFRSNEPSLVALAGIK
ncbi:hypothetical protein HZB78_00265 [Candidatus Collierbacteria bacterium]|nr:hypothetical protein [Candidatus Collierbacteria bacterium]